LSRMVSIERERESTSSRAEGAGKRHAAIETRACSSLLNCPALRGKAKPRSSTPIGVSDVEGPRRGISTYLVERASHNRRPLSTASFYKGSPPWSSLFVDASVGTPRVAESSTSASTATADKFAAEKRVVTGTAGLNAMRQTVSTRISSKADLLIASDKRPTANVRLW